MELIHPPHLRGSEILLGQKSSLLALTAALPAFNGHDLLQLQGGEDTSDFVKQATSASSLRIFISPACACRQPQAAVLLLVRLQHLSKRQPGQPSGYVNVAS